MAKRASNNTFEFVGNIVAARGSDKFTPYEERIFDSGWANRTLRFNVVCGDNRHMVEIKGGCWRNARDNVVKTFSIQDPETHKCEPIEIPWGQRLNRSEIARVAEFRRNVIDLEQRGRRQALERLLNDFDNGTVSGEQIESLGVDSELAAQDAYNKSLDKRHEYITDWDFAEAVKNIVYSTKYENTKFCVRGSIEISEYNGKFYTHYVVKRIYLANPNDPVKSEGTIVATFGRNAVDAKSIDETGCYYVDAYTFCYDSQRRSAIACSIPLEIPCGNDEKQQKLAALLAKNFTIGKSSECDYRELGIKIDIVDGAEKQEITEDMLDDNQRELLAIGAMTMDELRKEFGGTVYGERVRKWVVNGFGRGYSSGARDTAFSDADFEIAPIEQRKAKEPDMFD